MKIRLFTKAGEFVRDGELPTFTPAPEVVTWGDRVFVRNPTFDLDHMTSYSEGLSYPLEVADRFGS